MFNFLEKIFGKKKAKESSNKSNCGDSCCGGTDCQKIGDVQKDLNLTNEDIEIIQKLDHKIVIGKVKEIKDHPDPKVTKVKVSKTEVAPGVVEQILCGGVNLTVGDIVVVATVGAKLSANFEIGVRNIRGEESRGMICSRIELGLSPNGEKKGEIWQLPADYEIVLGKKLLEL
jgi:tRNA-binding EMAP/Myf-like protein